MDGLMLAQARVGGWVVQPCRCCGGLAAKRWRWRGAALASLRQRRGEGLAADMGRYQTFTRVPGGEPAKLKPSREAAHRVAR